MQNSEDGNTLEEILVTANKREQNINSVGMTITALSADTLKTEHISSLDDLSAAVPGLQYAPTQNNTPVYSLRGVGFYETTLANYPSVSVYIDEVPLPFPVLTTHAIFDLDRIEVMKGPQGTLFGENATGGAINFIAAKPTDVLTEGGSLSYGNFNRVEGAGFVSGPIAEGLTARLALDGVRSNDWQQSYTRDATLGAQRYIAARLVVDWQATALKLVANLNGWQDNSEPQAPQFQTIAPLSYATILPGVANYPFAPQNPRAADWDPGEIPKADDRMFQGSLRGDLKVASSITLTSITSAVEYKQNSREEVDGTIYQNSDYTSDAGEIRSLGEELRLANSNENTARWVIGTNYEHSDVSQAVHADYRDTSNAPLYGYTGDISSSVQELRNYAGFGNLEFDVVPDVTLKGGARYTVADRRDRACTADPGDGSFAPVLDGLSQAIQDGFVPVAGFTPTGVTVPASGSGCAALDNIPIDGAPATYLPSAYNATLDEHNISWHGGIDYKPTQDFLYYLNVSKGFKAGSLPLVSAATLAQYQPVKQESLLDYETGFKLQGLQHRLLVTGAVFYYDYKNKQERARILDPIFGPLSALANIPKSTIKGIESQVDYIPLNGLKFGLGVTYLDSRVDEFTDISASGQETNYAGAALPYTPRFQVNFSGDYQWAIGNLEPFVGFTVSSRSTSMANIGGSIGFVPPEGFRSEVPISDTFKMDGYTLLDLRAGITRGPWRVQLYGKNVADKYYVNNIFTAYETQGRLVGMPATYGVTFAYNY